MFDVPQEPLPSHPEPPPDIELVFRPYPKEGAEDRIDEARFIKTTANATGKTKQKMCVFRVLLSYLIFLINLSNFFHVLSKMKIRYYPFYTKYSDKFV